MAEIPKRIHTNLLSAALLFGLIECAPAKDCVDPPESRTAATYQAWVSEGSLNSAAVADFSKLLRDEGVLDIIPMNQLLRSSSRWKMCDSSPYSVPDSPEKRARMVQTLKLAKELKARGLLPTGEVASGYRNGELNGCACGAPDSQHLHGAALDFYPDARFGAEKLKALCGFWRREGAKPEWQMGISQYKKSGRIHIDAGERHRTWPADHLICKR